MKSLFIFFKILTPKQLNKSFLVLFLMIVGAFWESAGIGFILPLIDLMGNLDFLSQHPEVEMIATKYGISSHTELVVILTSFLLLFFILKNIFIGIQVKLQIRFAMNLQSFFMNKLLENYLSKPYEFFLKTNPAVVQRNILESTRNVFSSILLPIFQLITEIVTASAIGLMIFIIDPLTAILLSLFMMTLLCIIIKSFRRRISKQGVNQTKYATEMFKWTNQSIGAIKETKILRKEYFFLNSFKNACSIWTDTEVSYQFFYQLPRLFIETASVIGLLSLILVQLSLGKNTSEIIPLIGVLALSAFRLMPSANRIISTYNGIKFQLPNLEILYEDLINIKDQETTGIDIYTVFKENKMSFEKQIEIKNLVYSYPSNNPNLPEKKVLNGLSLLIPKGKFVGIVGQSGSGKTTFVDVLLGLLKPTAGSICIDGENVQKDIRGWQANLSYVPQSIYLIDGSIKENIALGEKTTDIDENKINKVLEMAELSDFIKSLANGIETNVGDRGIMLSGGQKQRIGIARALYTNPEVLILDEATSALDTETEKNIMGTILKLKGKITIISIAHRVSTLDKCDFKIRFERGKSITVN